MNQRFRYDFKSGIVADGKGDFISYAEYEALRQKLVAVTEQRDALVVEMKSAFEKPQAYLTWHAIPPTWEDPLPCGEYLDVHDTDGHKNSDGTDCWPVYAKPETPTTDAARAALRAEVVEMLKDLLSEIERGVEDTIDLRHYCSDFARQLRESKGANHEA